MRRLSAIAALLAMCSCSEQSCSGILVTGGSASLKIADAAMALLPDSGPRDLWRRDLADPDTATPDAGAVANCDQYTTNLVGCYSMDSDDMDDADSYTDLAGGDDPLDCTVSGDVEASAYFCNNTPSGSPTSRCQVTDLGATGSWSMVVWSTRTTDTLLQNLMAPNANAPGAITVDPSTATTLYQNFYFSGNHLGSISTDTSLTMNVTTYDGTDYRTYIDGVLDVGPFSAADVDLADMILCDYAPGNSDAWAGRISEVRAYSAALSQDDIDDLFALGD